MSDSCLWTWTDNKETVLLCQRHAERKLVKPTEKADVVRLLTEAGEWGGSGTLAVPDSLREGTETALIPSVVSAPTDIVRYESAVGHAVELSVQGFRELLCRDASAQQARFMMAWCQHNRIDPYANEAYFSIMDGKPVIQVSKDAWFKRMEAHPNFASHDSGVLVRVSIKALQFYALTEHEDYLINPALKAHLLDPEATLPEDLTIKKRGQFVDFDEELVGGWAIITKRDGRLQPFQIPLKGWEGKKGDGLNIFWREKESFMIWKSALKNCVRLTFPDLSGILGVPEVEQDQTDVQRLAAPSKESQWRSLLRELHAAAANVPAPYGPLNHDAIRRVATHHHGVESLTELSPEQLSALIALFTSAQADVEVAAHLTYIGDRPLDLSLANVKRSES